MRKGQLNGHVMKGDEAVARRRCSIALGGRCWWPHGKFKSKNVQTANSVKNGVKVLCVCFCMEVKLCHVSKCKCETK